LVSQVRLAVLQRITQHG